MYFIIFVDFMWGIYVIIEGYVFVLLVWDLMSIRVECRYFDRVL